MAETYPYWVEVVKDPEPDNGHPLLARKGMFGLIIRAWVGDPNYVMRSCLWVHKDQIAPLLIKGRNSQEISDDLTWCSRIAENQENSWKYLPIEKGE